MSEQFNFNLELQAIAQIPTIQKKQLSIAVIGAGAWGSALAFLAAKNGHNARLWSRSSPDKLEDIIAHTDLLISAVSMSGVRSIVTQAQQAISPNTIIVTATKGLDPQTTCTPSQIWSAAFPENPVVILSGPNLSEEIQQGLPAATVVANKDHDVAKTVQAVFNSQKFRVYTNPDPLGVELGGTL
ncbi:MAG TPA: NAD(P)-binding domain-containing protein, partial [Candidatus Sericytochromatia bacterium]